MSSKALLKALRCLEALQLAETPITVREIAQATGESLGSVQRSTFTLKALGYLTQESGAAQFMPGPACLRPAYGYLRNNALLNAAMPYMVELSDRLDVRCDLTILSGTDIIYLARIPGRDDLLNLSFLGRRWPAINTATGRAMLSLMPDDACEKVLMASAPKPITPKTITSMTDIRQEIDEARTLGYAKMLEEVFLGASAVAAPISGQSGVVLGALMIGGAADRFTMSDDRHVFGQATRKAAQAISEYGL